MGDALHRAVLAQRVHLHELTAADMHGVPERNHLQLHGNAAQMFDGARRPGAAIADKAHGLAHPFLVGLIERVLQRRRNGMVVFPRHDHETVELRQRLLPANGPGILTRSPEVRGRLVEERQIEIAQIKLFESHVSTGSSQIKKPLRRLVREPRIAGGPDDDTDTGFIRGGHFRPPFAFLVPWPLHVLHMLALRIAPPPHRPKSRTPAAA